jgi:hypothetical protein
MSSAQPNPHIHLDLTGQEFKVVIRALTGALSRPEDLENAHEFGIRLLDQYIRTERDRIKQLTGALRRLQEPEGAQEVPEEPEHRVVPVTILRPGHVPLRQYAHR